MTRRQSNGATRRPSRNARRRTARTKLQRAAAAERTGARPKPCAGTIGEHACPQTAAAGKRLCGDCYRRVSVDWKRDGS